MYESLVVAIVLIGAVFLALTVLIVLNKGWRESRARWRRVRRFRVEPRVLAFVHGDEASILPRFPGGVGRLDRAVLEDVLLDHVQRVKGIAQVRIRKAIDELGYVDRYLERLRQRRWWDRAQAAERLGLAGAARATDRLIAAMEDPEPEVRIRAAKALGTIGGKAAIRPLVHALDERSRWSSIRIADILTDMGVDVVTELTTHFPSLTPAGKVAALDVLGRVRSLHVAPWIRERANDPDRDVRARACHALGAVGDPDAGPTLRRALRDPDWPVRAMGAKALGKIRQLEAIPDLCETMRDREWWVRSNSARALQAMGAPGRDALVWMLEDRDEFARHQAVLMLEESGFLDEKVETLALPEAQARADGEAFVKRFLEIGQTGRLHELAANHGDARVRGALRTMIERSSAAGEARS
jgi:HEAT repeat protein